MSRTEEPRFLSRRRFVQVASGALAGGVVATLIAACGPSGAAPSGAPQPPTSAPAAKPTTAAPAAAANPTGATGAQAAPAVKPKSGASLKILVWSHFVPAYDDWLDNYAKSWGDKNKVEVKVD